MTDFVAHVCFIDLRNNIYYTVWTGNVVPAEIVRRPPGDPPRGVPWIFLAKSLVIPAIYIKFKLIAHKFKLEFRKYGWTISAGTTLPVHTVH